MNSAISNQSRSGFSLLEVVLSAALFLVLASSLVSLVLFGLSVERWSLEYQTAAVYAEEGRDAVRMLRKAGFGSLGTITDGGASDDGSGGLVIDGSPDVFGQFERRITIADIARLDGGGEDGTTKRITVTVSWPVGAAVPRSVTLTDYLVHWENEF